MKAVLLAVFALSSIASAQTDFEKKIAASNYKATALYPAASQKGSFLYEWIAQDVAEKKQQDPNFFRNSDWPYQITLQSVWEITSREWGARYCERIHGLYDEIRDTYRGAIRNGYSKETKEHFDRLFWQIKNAGDLAMDDEHTKGMRAVDRGEFLNKFNALTKRYNADQEALEASLERIEGQRSAASTALAVESLNRMTEDLRLRREQEQEEAQRADEQRRIGAMQDRLNHLQSEQILRQQRGE